MRVSVSETLFFDDCRRKWDYGSPNRQNLTSKQPTPALFFGSAIHAGLEAYYGGGDAVQGFQEFCRTRMAEIRRELSGVPLEKEAEIRDQVEMGEGMLRHYEQYYTAEPFKVVATEQEFEVAIPGTEDGMLVGTVDGFLVDQRGRVWLLEHKTFLIEPPPEFLTLDRQTTFYQWACQKLIHEGYFDFLDRSTVLQGVLYNGLKKKLPIVPRLLQSGKLSVAKSMDTTYETFLGAVEKQGQEPSEYQEFLDFLQRKPNKFFKREWVRRSPAEIQNAERHLQEIYRQMTSPDMVPYPHPSWDCSWRCDFRNLCIAEQTGVDTELMLQQGYRKAPPRGKVYASGSPSSNA